MVLHRPSEPAGDCGKFSSTFSHPHAGYTAASQRKYLPVALTPHNASTEIATMPSSPSTSTAKWPRDLSWCGSRQTTETRMSGSPDRSHAGSTPRLRRRKSRMKTLSRSHRAERQSQPSWSTAKVQALRAPFALTRNVRYIIRAVLFPSADRLEEVQLPELARPTTPPIPPRRTGAQGGLEDPWGRWEARTWNSPNGRSQ
jgi:hypothetical protein